MSNFAYVSRFVMIAQVSHCYKDLVNEFIKQLMDMLTNQGPQLDADMRMVCAREDSVLQCLLILIGQFCCYVGLNYY